MPASNFRQNRNKQSPASIDGIFGGSNNRRSSSMSDFRPRRVYQPGQRIDDFGRRQALLPNQRQGRRPTSNPSLAGTSSGVQSSGGHFSRALNNRSAARKRNWRRIASRSAASVAAATFVLGGFLVVKGYLDARQIFKGGSAGAAALQEGVDPSLLKGEGDGRINILLLGKGGLEHTGGDLTDTLLIASIDPIQKEASLLSIPRDLYLEAPNLGPMKVNAVYATAKQQAITGHETAEQLAQIEARAIEVTQKALEQSMGIPIHYYGMVDFEGFRRAIDTVGGVTIDVEQQLYDPSIAWENNNNPLIAAKGRQTLNSQQALLYARSRYSSERGDFDRGVRQREIIIGLKSEVLSANTFSNPLKISQLVETFGNNAQTNLSINELVRLHEIAKEIDASKISSIGLSDPPNDYVTTDFVGGQSVVVPRAGLFNYKDIQHFVRNSLKDGFIRNENARIVVLNGTSNEGVATEKAEELRSFGYNVTEVANAPSSGYRQTTLVDMRGGANKYTERYLEQRLRVNAVSSLPDSAIAAGDADFVIILGQD